jgi:hypothetical protein
MALLPWLLFPIKLKGTTVMKGKCMQSRMQDHAAADGTRSPLRLRAGRLPSQDLAFDRQLPPPITAQQNPFFAEFLSQIR